MAGLTGNTKNISSYLYTNKDYWSMTSWCFNNFEGCILFHVT